MQETGEMVVSQTPLTSLAASVRTAVGSYHRVRLDATAQSIWWKLGDVTVVATLGTAGESLMNAAGVVEFTTGPNQTNVAIIAAVAGANASVTVFG